MQIPTDRKMMIVVSAVLVAFIAAGGMMGHVVAVEGPYGYLKLFNEALYLIVNNYVEPVQLEDLMEGAYRGLLEALDPSNEYLTQEEYQRAARGEESGPAGVGLTLSKRRGYAVVVSALPHSPAAEAGIRTGDLVISVDNRSTRQMGVWEAEQSLKGKPGTKMVMHLSSPDGGKQTLTLVRKTIGPVPPSAALVPPQVGVVRLNQLREGDARRVDQAIASLRGRGAQRLLLDLRGCASDSLPEAVGVVSLFVRRGPVVTVTDRYEGDKTYQADGRRQAWSQPLAILVDEGTARTCEVIAAGLRDAAGTPIVGQRTWGAGTLRQLLPLRNGDGLFLAVEKMLSPSGKEWNGKGIEPDLTIEGQESDPGDPQRGKAIDYLRGLSPPAARNAA
jgi:carboxyl-terminal processing protease